MVQETLSYLSSSLGVVGFLEDCGSVTLHCVLKSVEIKKKNSVQFCSKGFLDYNFTTQDHAWEKLIQKYPLFSASTLHWWKKGLWQIP